jgi:hypothetical protein
MNTQRLRSKRVVIPTVAAAALIGVGGVAWGSSGDGELKGDDLDRASKVALDAVGEGEVTDTEVGDEEGAYEIEVTKADGSQVDVHLDESFQVISLDPDDETEPDDDADDADDGAADDD